MKKKISELQYEIDDTSEEEELERLGQTIIVLSKNALENIILFQRSTPIFDHTFIFKNNVSMNLDKVMNMQDYEKFIRRECSEIRNLLFAYGIDIKDIDLDFDDLDSRLRQTLKNNNFEVVDE